MPRRVRQSRTFLGPLAENFIKRLSSSDARLRRRIVRYGSWIITIIFLLSLVNSTYGIPRIVRLELRKHNLIEGNRDLTIELIDAERIRQMLRSDPLYIEKIARTRYRMVYPGETIYRFRGQK